MRLTLIRHGETANNAGGFVQGRVDLPLNELGQLQAAAIADSLRSESIDLVVTSPLRRAFQTASMIASRQGLTPALDHDLVEMDLGEIDGLSGERMRTEHAAFLEIWRGPDGPTTPMPGGESLQQVQARGWDAIQRLYQQHQEGSVVVVSHNFVIMSIICRAIGAPLTQFRRMQQGIAGRTVIEMRPERTLITALNDTCHLDHAALRSGGPWERR